MSARQTFKYLKKISRNIFILSAIVLFSLPLKATPNLEGVTGNLTKPNALVAPHLNFHFNLLGWCFPYHFSHSALASFFNRVEVGAQIEYKIYDSAYFDRNTTDRPRQPYFNINVKGRWLGPLKGFNFASMIGMDIATRYWGSGYLYHYNPRFSFYTMVSWSLKNRLQITVGAGLSISNNTWVRPTETGNIWVDAFISAEFALYRDIILMLIEFSNYSYNSFSSFYRGEFRGMGNIGFRFNPIRWISITVGGYDLLDGNRHFGVTATLKVGKVNPPDRSK